MESCEYEGKKMMAHSSQMCQRGSPIYQEEGNGMSQVPVAGYTSRQRINMKKVPHLRSVLSSSTPINRTTIIIFKTGDMRSTWMEFWILKQYLPEDPLSNIIKGFEKISGEVAGNRSNGILYEKARWQNEGVVPGCVSPNPGKKHCRMEQKSLEIKLEKEIHNITNLATASESTRERQTEVEEG
ncbi:hypothetical protein CBL_00911 [Carabus blaptoides fortunei]